MPQGFTIFTVVQLVSVNSGPKDHRSPYSQGLVLWYSIKLQLKFCFALCFEMVEITGRRIKLLCVELQDNLTINPTISFTSFIEIKFQLLILLCARIIPP